MRLTLRTLLAYLDDTLPGEEAKAIGYKVAESPAAQELIEKIKRVTRRRGLSTPPNERGNGSDPNTVAEYLSDALTAGPLLEFENLCLDSDVHLAEVAACHQILTLLLSEPVRVPPTARQRMYRLVSGPESLPNKKPGSAIPVGGVSPDEVPPGSDDADAAYLLGMPAFARTESRGQRIAQIAILGGLVLGLGLATYAVWPTTQRAETLTRSGPIVLGLKNNDGQPKVDAAGNENPAPAVPMPPAVEPKFEEPMTAEPVVKSDPPQAVDLLPKPQPPRNDAFVVSKFEVSDRVLLAERDGKWVRVLPKMPQISTGERLIAPPGFSDILKLDSGVQVELWGNVPELVLVPVLHSSITLHVPYDGFDADLTLHAGRIYLTTARANGATVRVRCQDEIWDVTLVDNKSDVALETVGRIVPGLTMDVDPSEKPQISYQLAVVKGSARVKSRHKSIPELTAGETIVWTNKGPGLQGPKRLPMGQVYARTPTNPNDPFTRATIAVTSEFAENFKDPEAARVRLAEMLVLRDPGFNETPQETYRRLVKPGLAVLAHAAIGDLPPVIDALVDESRPRVRDAAAYGLQAIGATSPGAVEEISRLLMEKSRLTAEQSRIVARYLRGPSPAEKLEPATLDLLVEGLNSPILAIRELAFWQLLNEVDPDARSIRVLSGFDAAAAPLAREGAANAWKRRIEDMKKKLPQK